MIVPVSVAARRQVVMVPGLERAAGARLPQPDAGSLESRFSPVVPQEAGPAVLTMRRGTWSATRKLSVAVAVTGAGALGTGIYFGWRAKDLQDRADQRCPLTVCADPEGLRMNDQARTSAMRANILYIAGGATLATAVLMWFVGAPGETVVRPMAGPHQVGISMRGKF
jgi:hypothetical protein